MTTADLREIALDLNGATEDIKWGDHLCFNIGEKMFLVTSPDMVPSNASFKVPAEKFEEIISREGFTKHAYLGRHFWVRLDDIKRLNKEEWKQMIRESYLLVASKLPVKTKKTLGLL